MTTTQFLLALASQLDSLLIGRFAGANALGLYRQAYNLTMAPIERLNAPIFSVAQPGLSILQSQPKRYKRYYQRILFAVGLATIPLGLFLAVYAEEIVVVALGEKWSGAAVFLRIFGALAAMRPVLGTSGVVLITLGRSGKFLLANVVNSTLVLVLMLVGITWGAVGIAGARLAAMLLFAPWWLHYCFTGTPVSSIGFIRTVSRPLVAGIVMVVALVSLEAVVRPESSLLSLAMGSGSAIAVYFLALNLLPGGRAQLRSLIGDLVAALRRKASSGPEPRGDPR